MKYRNLQTILGEFISLSSSRKTIPLKPVYVFLDVLTDPELTPQHYARRLNETKSTIGKQLNYLEELDLVERKPNPSNGREKLVHLTISGKLLGERINEQLS
ncbi:MarR family transcriptional regulator [Terasakiella pusilla]|uniref:MarR family transcriptional regulator n=1 Tax=Terasakiella pusilla TaxID=64973 RepID=UPI0004909F6C